MKIAVESNDGVNIASPLNSKKNFMVFEIDKKNDLINLSTSRSQFNHKNQLMRLKNISKIENIENELSDCSTVISHNLNRPLFNNLRKFGVDIYITFHNKVDDAIRQYLKDKFIHNFC